MARNARLKYQRFSDDSIYKIAIDENLFQVNTDARKKEIASTIIPRLKGLDNFLLDKLVNVGVDTSKQIALYALMKTDDVTGKLKGRDFGKHIT